MGSVSRLSFKRSDETFSVSKLCSSTILKLINYVSLTLLFLI